MTDFPPENYEGDEGNIEPVRIAVITFAFNNAEIIHNLRLRGKLIATEKWEKLDKLNAKMVDRLHNSIELLDKMQTPVSCFMSMETEEGKARAANYNSTVEAEGYEKYKTFLGEEIDMQEASEPSDIIWENRHFTSGQRLKRTILVTLLVFFMLCISFVLIFTAQKNSLAMKQKYPKQNCVEIGMDYENRRSAWKKDAIGEYLIN